MGRTGLSTQFHLAEESAYGTPATLSGGRSLEIREESLEDAIERIESEALRAGRSVQQHWRPNRKGGEGSVTFELANKGFGLLWKHCLGAIATAAAGTLGQTHTATIGALAGKSLTTQVGRPDVAGVTQPFTLHGCKVAEWTIGNEVDGIATLELALDFEESDTVTALATAAYPSGLELFDFIGATISVGGSAVAVADVSVSCANNLKTDRYFLRGSSLKKEPLEDTEAREITAELTGEFEGLTAYNRFVGGTEASFQATWVGSEFEAGQNYKIDITASRCRFDGTTPTAGGMDVLEQPQNIKILAPHDGSSAISIAYTTLDATP